MKRTFVSVVIMVIVLVCSMQAEAVLQNLGTDSLGNRLIYDTDLNITWYDFSNPVNTWQNQTNWTGALSVTFGNNTYTDWRLPTSLNQNGSGPCSGSNCIGSEMGHLYYTELINSSGGPLSNTGDFEHLLSYYFWSGTEYSPNTSGAWGFGTYDGTQGSYDKSLNLNAIAVRPGLAVSPEPVSMVLFGVGGVILAARRKLSGRWHR